jgi:hypothetical protein
LVEFLPQQEFAEPKHCCLFLTLLGEAQELQTLLGTAHSSIDCIFADGGSWQSSRTAGCSPLFSVQLGCVFADDRSSQRPRLQELLGEAPSSRLAEFLPPQEFAEPMNCSMFLTLLGEAQEQQNVLDASRHRSTSIG